ncbi:MAG: hypothetical protein ACU84Q_02205 [Gammaproteobacteria bacterium]
MKDEFAKAAQLFADKSLEKYKALTPQDIEALPRAQIEDVVISGKEVQVTVFKQVGVPPFANATLVTVQIVRAGLGGILNYQYEKGLVFDDSGYVREATDYELQATG